MARSHLLSLLSLAFLVLFNGCLSQIERTPLRIQGGGQRQHHRFHSPRACRLENLRAQEPIQRIEAEAGVTEIWDEDDEQFQCAGVALVRHIIEPKGLLQPSFSNSPKMFYVVQGRGLQGVAIPGCPETYQTETVGSQRGREEGSTGGRFRDQHQKIRQFQEGDVVILPAGVAHWIYNRGQSQLVLIALFDTRNVANQLDQNLRKFYLAGNPKHVETGRERERSGSARRAGGQQGQGGNILSGFDDEILADSFDVDVGLIRKMKGQDDFRDRIVRTDENFERLLPERDEEELRRAGRQSERYEDLDNGIDETMCTLRLKHNIGRPDRADVFNPRGGRISTVNSHNLPILRQVRLSAERGVLYSNAIVGPHYSLNSHTIVYITRGSGRLQVVDNFGQCVFDGELQEGQVLTIPQNFVVIKRASDRGFEWIAFKTNDNAITNWLAGRVSQMRLFPVGVLANSYRISKDEARRLKYDRQEMAVFSPGRIEGRRRD